MNKRENIQKCLEEQEQREGKAWAWLRLEKQVDGGAELRL